MSVSRNNVSRAVGRAITLSLVLTAFFLISAKSEDPGFWSKVKTAFNYDKEKPLPPAEEVFSQAEEYYFGRETWYGRAVRKIHGEDSKAYKKLPGVKRKNYQKAKDLYQQVVDNYPFSKYAPLAELKTADCHFELGEYIESAVWYEQFVKLHPGRPEAAYATYKQAMSHYEQILKPFRDQSETLEALVIFEQLNSRYSGNEYEADAAAKILECKDILVQTEFLVADFYFKRNEYWSAAMRYQGVWVGYSGLGYDARAKFMEARCYEELSKPEKALPLLSDVAEKYGDTEYGQKAVNKLKSAGG